MADIAEDVPFTNAATAISQGKRHLLVRDYSAAVTALAGGLELLSKKHGDCADELGEPYLLYGRALLGLAREEAGVLGGGVPGSEDADEAEEADEDIDDEEGDDDKLSNIDEKDEDENENGNENVEDVNKTDDKKIEEKNSDENEVSKPIKNITESKPGSSKDEVTTNGNCSNEVINDDNVPSGSGIDNDNDEDDVNKEEDEDEPGRGIDLQVAWEVLELAKIVFFKRGKSGFKNLAEAHRLLGEVAMESGNHQGAVSDLEQALKILENVEPYESRSIAELHYQLGLAYSLLNDFDASIEQFNEATNLLESRIKELEMTKEPPKSDDPFYTIEGEIKELKELLPEIREKIADMKDFKQETCRLVIEGIKSKVAGSCTNGAGPSTDPTSSIAAPSTADAPISPKEIKPASDISHLVRKKRKADEPQESASPCKKPTP